MTNINSSLEQRHAISPLHSCWVEASAGTGKTRVLTDRVLSLLLTGCLPEDILCLTFTKAAASEMLNRIQNRLSSWSSLKDTNLQEELHEFLGRPPTSEECIRAPRLFSSVMDASGGMKIQTIHAFCQMILKKFPFEAGIVPYFTVMDESKSRMLQKKAFQEALETLPHSHVKILSTYVTPQSLFELMERLLTTNRRGEAVRLDSDDWTRRIYEYLDIPFGVTPEEILMSYVKEFTFPSSWIDILKNGSKTEEKISLLLTRWRQQTLFQRIREFDSYSRIFLTEQGDIRQRILSSKTIQKNPDLASFFQTESERVFNLKLRYHHALIAEATISLRTLEQKCVDLYHGFKEKESCLDYDDLISKTVDLFHRPDIAPWVLYKLDGGIRHILVDEAQDTNQDQWQVIASIASEFFSEEPDPQNLRTLFVVGDMKQSIYSFQGASPVAFQAVKNFFSSSAQISNHSWRHVQLATSFRSTEPILTLVDSVFQKYPHLSPAGIDLSYSPHKAHRLDQPGCVEIWPLTQSPEQEEHLEWTMPIQQFYQSSSKQEVARKIANHIQEWLTQKRILPAKGRPIKPSDIMILVRRRDQFVEELVRSLKNRSIPVTGVDRLILRDHIAIMDLLALGDFLLLPEDDLSLAAVLKSPLIGLTEEDLFTLCNERGNSCLWVALKKQAHEKPSYQEAQDFLSALLSRVDFDSPFELYSYILHQKQGRKKMMERLGPDAEDVLEEFLNLTITFEQENESSLQKFLSWIKLESTEVKRNLDSSGDDQVRIMTIHGAKGLQAPVVFLPDTTQIPSPHTSLFWDNTDLDFPSVFWCPKASFRSEKIASLRPHHDERAEYYRLLYVALTRAEDELYIAGWNPPQRGEGLSWYNMILETMKTIGTPFMIKEEEGWRLEKKTSLSPCDAPVENLSPPHHLPHWLFEECLKESSYPVIRPSLEETFIPAPMEPKEQASVSSKSHGILIHRLLEQSISLLQGSSKETVKHPPEIEGILSLLKEKGYFRTGTLLTETPIHSFDPIRQGVVKGVIDLLWIHDQTQTIHLIDYKTGTFHPQYRTNPPEMYKNQMMLYREAVHRLYPSHRIDAFLLWTSLPELIKITKWDIEDILENK